MPPPKLLLGEQARLNGLGQFHLVLGRQQRHPADFPQVDPHQVAGGNPSAGVGPLLGQPDVGFGVVLMRHIEHIHALVRERAHRRVDGVRREIGAIQRHHDVSHGQGTSFPP